MFAAARICCTNCRPCVAPAIHLPPDHQRGALQTHAGVDINMSAGRIILLHRERLTEGFSSTSPEATPGDVHGSESVDCDSLDWPQPPDPFSHHRAGNAIRIPQAAPYLSFGRQSEDPGNASTAWRLLWARATTPFSMSDSRQDTSTRNRRNFDGTNATMLLQ